MTFGVIYLAFGRPYVAMAGHSIVTLKKFNPVIPVCLVSNEDIDTKKLPSWTRSDHFLYVNSKADDNRVHKIKMYNYSPFNKTLYLDCDTQVLGQLHRIKFFLEYFDIAARPGKSPGPVRDRGKQLFDGRWRFEDLPHWNGGVIAFRKCEAAQEFFELWNDGFQRMAGKRDQPALVEAMFFSKCRVLSLEPIWNNGDSLNGDGLLESNEIRDRSIIWHYKWDIDRQMANDIISAGQQIFGDDGKDIKEFIMGRVPKTSLRHPGQIVKRAIRAWRGRLPDRSRGSACKAARENE